MSMVVTAKAELVEVTGKKDLSSAPVLRRLAEGEG